ncbi:MAG TPA: hypothetical protein VJN18_23560 [Polyangiaceae bacterium]|nr:hypothetical protein [Polyangiaceae bacterium]
MPSRAEPHRGALAPHSGVLRAIALALAAGLAIACRDVGTSDQATRPLPAPEPPATTAALPRDDVASPPKKASDQPSTKPRRAADEERSQPASPAVAPAGDTAAPAAPEGTSDSAAPVAAASAPAVEAPSAACVARCQSAMQGCLSAPVDGGVPGFGNIEVCKKAFEACQSACSKQ